MGYAELHCLTNFTFLRGASHPEELVERAQAARLRRARDHRRMLGRRRRARACRRARGRLAADRRQRVPLADGLRLVCARDQPRRATARLRSSSRAAGAAAPKGRYRLARADLDAGLADCLALWLPGADAGIRRGGLARASVSRAAVDRASSCSAGGADRARLRDALPRSARELGLPPSPPATCTCTCAAGARCRTC